MADTWTHMRRNTQQQQEWTAPPKVPPTGKRTRRESELALFGASWCAMRIAASFVNSFVECLPFSAAPCNSFSDSTKNSSGNIHMPLIQHLLCVFTLLIVFLLFGKETPLRWRGRRRWRCAGQQDTGNKTHYACCRHDRALSVLHR
jgi:hypothetical protein